jgi:hypothetical protein
LYTQQQPTLPPADGCATARLGGRAMHLVFCLLLAAFFTPLVNSADVGAQPPLLSVSSDADSAAAAGTELGQLTKQAIPELERLWDSYLAALMAQAEFDIALGGRVAQLRATGIDDDTREEISAFAAELDLVARNRLGDGHLSMDELWTVQFLQDLMAFSKGWAFAIERGASGPGGHGSRLMVGRNLELDSAPVLAALHAIVRQRIGERVVVNPGFGGLLGVLNGFNDEGLVAALISAPGAGDDGASSRDRSAIAFALRRTLGRCARAECAVRLLRTHRFYGSHGILLADRNGARVLELAADQSGRVRRAADPTRPEMRWDNPKVLAAVACLVDARQMATCASLSDRYRWQRLRQLLATDDGGAPARAYRLLFDRSNAPYALFNASTAQSLLFDLGSGDLFLYAKGPDAGNSETPLLQRYARAASTRERGDGSAWPWVFGVVFTGLILAAGTFGWYRRASRGDRHDAGESP